MQLPNDFSILLLVGLLFFIASFSVSLALAIDSFRSESFFTAARIVNSVAIGYAAFLVGGIIYYGLAK
jgi:hypothetical protein